MRKYLVETTPAVVKKMPVVFEEDEEELIIINRKACSAFLRDTERKANRYFVGKAIQDLRSEFIH